MRPTQSELLEIFAYTPSTGVLVRAGNVRAGYGYPGDGGRRNVNVNGRLYVETHIIWCMMTGSWPSLTIDHKDRDPSNNKWENLRELNNQQQCMNRSTPSNNTSGVMGVSWSARKQMWKAYITVDNRRIHLGSFSDFDTAVLTRKLAEEKYFAPRLAA